MLFPTLCLLRVACSVPVVYRSLRCLDMKLRIRGNSLRLRLTQSEVRRVAAGERVAEKVVFGFAPEQSLVYAIEKSSEMLMMRASFDGREILVTVPQRLTEEWASNENFISLNGEQRIGADDFLYLLVEKDFACLTERRAEDADTFPHPLAGKVKC
jgi:hypothetical protein